MSLYHGISMDSKYLYITMSLREFVLSLMRETLRYYDFPIRSRWETPNYGGMGHQHRLCVLSNP